MLDKTIDLVVEYAILKIAKEKDENDKIINEGLKLLEAKILSQIKGDEPRMKQLEKDKERIRLKKEKPR